MSLVPLRLLPSFREKVWGSTVLEPWFRSTGAKIGEVWFTYNENQADTGEKLADLLRPEFLGFDTRSFPILTKFIYTSERLSVQVHPADDKAWEWEKSPGKTEMWYVLRAEAGASVAVGPRERLTVERLKESALSGEIEQLLSWHPVKPGDTIFTPPGTIHAIGAGLTLVEIQQNSDVTYRLYDYGRPRPLHLDKGLAVSDLNPHPGPQPPLKSAAGYKLLACCRYFATELLDYSKGFVYQPDPARLHTLVTLEGTGAIAGRTFGPGECWLIPASAPPFELRVETPVRLLRTFVPSV